MLGKILLIPIVVFGLIGIGGAAVLSGADDVLPDWGGMGGGCHGEGRGQYSDRGEGWEHPCHGYDEDSKDEEYCPYHDEHITEEEWEEHREDCPYHDEEW